MSNLSPMSSVSAARGNLPFWQAARLDRSILGLAKALGPDWVVERWSGCDRDLSVIVFSEHNPDDMPTFVLFEQDGVTRLGTVEEDEWTADLSFRNRQPAVDALVARAAVASRSSHGHAGLN